MPCRLRDYPNVESSGSSAAYNRLGANIDTPAIGGDVSIVSLTGNLTYRSSNAFGWNAGIGTKLYLVGLKTFLEARFHSTTRDGSRVNYFPISFGITF